MLDQVRILGRRFGIALLVATLCRFIFYFFNSYFHQFGFISLLKAFSFGILYDISALIYMHGIFIFLHLLPRPWFLKKWFQKLLLALFLLVQTVFVFFNLMDTGYFTFAGKRSGMEVFGMTKEADGLVGSYLYDYWYLVLILFVFIALSYLLFIKTTALVQTEKSKTLNWFSEIGLRLAIACLCIVGARGGVNLLPLNTFDAARQTQAGLVSLVVNTPFNLIISTQQQGLEKFEFMDELEAKSWFNPVQQWKADSSIFKASIPPNIVLIIVESLGKEYIGSYNGGKGYTPFLDSLMGCSEVFDHAYSNGKKSIEGIPAILSSMPTWMQTPYLSSYYQSNYLDGIGKYLSKMGYETSFYHGGKNGTMSFDNYIALSEGGKYFGKNEYTNQGDFDGHWGIYDKPYLHYFADELSKKKTPFFSTIFTLSSHHPYPLTEEDRSKFAKGTLPIHASIGYVDDALREFFAYAKNQDWYSNTTFILTADHSAENETSYYQSSQGKFEIPLLVFHPRNPMGIRNETTVSQIDILPIALEEANFHQAYFSFGTYNASSAKMHLALQYHDNYFQAINWPYVYQFDGKKPFGFYNLRSDSLMKNNLIKLEETKKQKEMDRQLKAIIQTYSSRVRKNQTSIQ
jgi:phosphoglycerol transferase MdoB-like AlkP superfamily enzyme